jgi:acetyl/propionyl-CoA carboxylase alpha subunit
MEFKAVINGKRELTVVPGKKGEFVIDGKTVTPDIRVTGPGIFSIINNNRSYVAEVLRSDPAEKTFVIRVNGNTYSLRVTDAFDKLLHDLGMDNGAARKVTELKAPMPGLVVDVSITEGMDVRKGDKLIVLEAMKMENILKAAADGVVKKINVVKGNTVEKNAILIQFQ